MCVPSLRPRSFLQVVRVDSETRDESPEDFGPLAGEDDRRAEEDVVWDGPAVVGSSDNRTKKDSCTGTTGVGPGQCVRTVPSPSRYRVGRPESRDPVP